MLSHLTWKYSVSNTPTLPALTLSIRCSLLDPITLTLSLHPTLAPWATRHHPPPPQVANALFLSILNYGLTAHAKQIADTPLATDAARYQEIQVDYVDKFGVNMSLFEPSNYSDFGSVNAWFTRRLRTGARPVASPLDRTVLTSSADCRLMVFPVVGRDTPVWIKNKAFTLEGLLQGGYRPQFEGGSIAIFRLAVQDYHHFHSPVNGTVLEEHRVFNHSANALWGMVSQGPRGSLNSVDADAAQSGNLVLYNKRIVQVLGGARGARGASGAERVGGEEKGFRDVDGVDGVDGVGGIDEAWREPREGEELSAFVSVGAVDVGSIVLHQQPGESVGKGEEMGYVGKRGREERVSGAKRRRCVWSSMSRGGSVLQARGWAHARSACGQRWFASWRRFI